MTPSEDATRTADTRAEHVMPRVDLFTSVHKGLRSELFETALEAARVDLASTCAVDALIERIDRLLCFLDEHGRHEDAEIVPAIRVVDPALAATLAAEHQTHEAAHHAVGRATRALALARADQRGVSGRHLMRVCNQLVSLHLGHMNHEETVVNAVLWGSLGDPELLAIRGRILRRISAERTAEWRAIMVPALDPAERALVLGGAVE